MLLKRGQEEGVFRANVDAVDLYLSISGLAYFFLSNQHTLSWLLDRDLAARRRVLKRRQHVVEMVLSYLDASFAGGSRRRRLNNDQTGDWDMKRIFLSTLMLLKCCHRWRFARVGTG